MEIFVLFVLGITVGSFLTVLVDRLPRNETVFSGRSHCESCKKVLNWQDLIPLVSFVILKGKCRYCHSRLSWHYPMVELTTGILFVITIYNLQSNLNFQLGQIPTLFYYLFIVSSLIVIFFADLKYGIIPDKIIFPTIVVALIYVFIIYNSLFLIHFLSAGGAFLFFLFLYFITRGKGMGLGDVKFAFLIGLVLGFPQAVVALYAAFLTGGVVGIMLILWGKKRLFGGATIPFGPFLAVATLLVLLTSQRWNF